MFNCSIPRIVISGLRGGTGKTILSLCLIALWRKKGLKVTPFKKGPDYIDAGWLAKASGSPCYNLDLFMMSAEQIVQSFITHTEGSQIAVIEGNRGLYDGVDHEGTYSTAELAKLLNAPVVIIMDCTKTTNTIAAMLLGCQKMDQDVSIKGVILNRIATDRQESLIRKAINNRCKIPVLGAIPRLKRDPFPERHMGLTPFQEHLDIEKALAVVADIGDRYLDMDGIWKVANEVIPLKVSSVHHSSLSSLSNNVIARSGATKQSHKGIESREIATSRIIGTRNDKKGIVRQSVRIGVIKDSAFQFYYQENFDELEKRGAMLIEINALKESKLPDVDALYIGGGFPETHAVALADNVIFKDSLLTAIEKGLPVYAECGGLMFLGKSLILGNKTYPMAGVLPITFSLEKRPQAHGYTIIEVENTNSYLPLKSIFKGHEFHYSRVLDIEEDGTYMAFKVKRGRGIRDKKDGLCYKNVLATYTHLHAIGTSEWADGLVRCAREFKNQAG